MADFDIYREMLNGMNIQELNILVINNCIKLAQIPHIQGLNKLVIANCPKLAQIPYIQGLNKLVIANCKCLKDIFTRNRLEIKRYLNRFKIKNWLRRMLFLKSERYKILWRIAEYYTKKKYSPENALKYLNLDN